MNELSDFVRLFKSFKSGLNMDGLSQVIENNRELKSSHLTVKAKPEEYTKKNLIAPTLEYIFGCRIDDYEAIFNSPLGTRQVDYTITTLNKRRYIIEAKPLNANLLDSGKDGAVEQIKRALALQIVARDFQYGIATDGVTWIFIDSNYKIIANLNIFIDFDSLYNLLGYDDIEEITKEEISKKFYTWYFALLNGGSYTDTDGNRHTIDEKLCLKNSIQMIYSQEDRESIAQVVFNRLIFIKFLESRKIVTEDILRYLGSLEPDLLNLKMKSLFFEVMNTPVSERGPVDTHFLRIPYLNSSLFTRTANEEANPDYSVSVGILRSILSFLNAFRFVKTDSQEENALDPEILGYIFEMSMNDTKRKGTGAYYTPKEITSYITREAIYRSFVARSKEVLMKSDIISIPESEISIVVNVDTIHKLPKFILHFIFDELKNSFRIVDPACGSGAFLLSAANVLLDLYKRITLKAEINISEAGLKRIILTKNIFGVDINSNAIEIAKLRLWLWMVDSFKDGYIEPLPNIDYNLRCGNSLVGLVDTSEFFKKEATTLFDFDNEELQASIVLKRRKALISEYKNCSGLESHKMKRTIDDVSRIARTKLTTSFYAKYGKKMKCTRETFESWQPLHWGFEFDNVMDNGGFDVVVGNPPYIDSELMVKDMPNEREAYRALYQSAKGNWDIFVLFVELSYRISRITGCVSLIVPNKIVSSDYAKSIRTIMAEKSIYELRDYSSVPVFKDADVYPITFVSDLNGYEDKVRLKVMEDRTKEKWSSAIDSTAFRTSECWDIYFANDERVVGIMGRMLFLPRLSEFAQINGAATVNEAYEIKELLHDGDLPDGIRFVNTGTIDPYVILWGTERTQYIKQSYDRPMISAKDLEQRYPTRYAEAMSEKIIVAGMAKRPECVYDEGCCLAGKSTIIIRSTKIDLKYLLGILNSTLISSFYRLYYNSKTMSGGYLNFSPAQIQSIPFKAGTAEQTSRMISLVNEAIESPHDENVLRKIDELVNVIYGISDEELSILTKSI